MHSHTFFFRALLPLLLFFSLGARVSGKTPLMDPSIPDGERTVYKVSEDENEWHVTEEVILGRENGREIYSITYSTDRERVLTKIEKETMISFHTETITERALMTVDSRTSVYLHSEIDSPNIVILSLSDLKYALRGFPFSKEAPDLSVSFLNSSDDDDSNFSIKVRYVKTEDIKVQSRVIPCHKLELKMSASGILRVLNTFIPKTYFWYSVEPPHYLVAYEGSGGFPGSSKQQIRITDYSGWDER